MNAIVGSMHSSRVPSFRLSVALPLLLLAILIAVPFIAAAIGQQFYVSFFARILIYAIAATALNLALGFGGLVGFGHALFFGIGAYAVSMPAYFGIYNGFAHLGFAIFVCAAVGFVTGLISLRTKGIAFIMITLAFAQMGYFVLVSLKQFGGDDGMSIAKTSSFLGLDMGSTNVNYFTAVIVLVAMLWWFHKLRAAPFGMALRATRQNLARVNALGLPAMRYQLTAYVISAVLCGLAGFLLANLNAFASPGMMSWAISGELIVMVVLGGMGSVLGPLVGAFIYLGLEEYMKNFTSHWMVFFGPIIVLVAIGGTSGITGLLNWVDMRFAKGTESSS